MFLNSVGFLNSRLFSRTAYSADFGDDAQFILTDHPDLDLNHRPPLLCRSGQELRFAPLIQVRRRVRSWQRDSTDSTMSTAELTKYGLYAVSTTQ